MITSPKALPAAKTAAAIKFGFVTLIGRSNVGKSTLLNSLVGTKVAITSEKPQTTRSQIQGIVNDPRGQIVFTDTPGMFQKAHDPLTARLNKIVAESIKEVDLILYVADPTRAIGNEENELLRMMENTPDIKKILVVNKSDLRDRPYEHEYERLASRFDAVMPVSALTGSGLKNLISAIFDLLPEGERYFPEYQLTTIGNREWFAELIREKVYQYLHEEIPYTVNVEVRELRNEGEMLVIGAAIITTATRYKKMIIGAGGKKIKTIGTATRKELELVLSRKVFVGLNVEVDPSWQDKVFGQS